MARQKPLLRAWPAPALLVLIYLGANRFGSAVSRLMHKGADPAYYYGAIILQQLIFYGLPAYLFMSQARGIQAPSLFIKRIVNTRKLLLVLALGAIHQLTMQLMTGLFSTWLESFGISIPPMAIPMPHNNVETVLLLTAIALIPAICEESLFRGAVLQSLRREFSDGAAIVLTALLFAFMHGNLAALPSHFMAGLMMTYLAFTTQCLFYCVAYHFIYNAVSYLTDAVNFLTVSRSVVLQTPALAAALMALLFLVGLFLLRPLVQNGQGFAIRKPSTLAVAAVAIALLFFLPIYFRSLLPV